MHPQAKHARFSLIVCSATVLLTAAAYIVALTIVGPQRARGAFGFFGLLGLLGLAPTFYHRRPGEARVILDERDKQIGDRSQVIAWRATWLYWILACLGPWLWVAIRSGLAALEIPRIPIEWLPWAIWPAFIVYTTAWSISILINYRHGEPKADE
jgi:hypothetical protein